MYKVMFVDDEENTLSLMEKIIDWEAYGFRVCAVALDGTEGLASYKEARPDVIFVDIRMQEMDGLTFISRIKEEGEDPVCVVLTAFSEFEYAKRAVQLGCRDFLLKPVDRKELAALADKIRKELDLRKEEEETARMAKKAYDRTKLMRRMEQLEGAFLQGTQPESRPDVAYPEGSSVLADLYSPNAPLDALEKLAGRLSEGRYLRRTDGFVFVADDPDHLSRIYEEAAGDYFRWRIYLDREGGICGWEEFDDAVRRLFERRRDHFYPDQAAGAGGGKATDPAGLSTAVTKFISGERDELLASIHGIFLEAAGAKTDPAELAMRMADLLMRIKTGLTDTYHERSFMVLRHYSQWDFQRIHTASRLELFITDILGKAADQITEIRMPDASSRMIAEAEQYIRERCSDPGFLASDVSDHLNLSRNYFLKLFKDEKHVSFSNYVTNLRIEKAKSLLKDTRMTVYTVSREVGYESQYHFSRKFKKVTGMTPVEFRNA